MVTARSGAARTPAQLFARVFGIVYILVGVLGFIPPITPNSALLGVFGINPLHNVAHLIVGAVWVFGSTSPANARMVNLVIGVLYLLLGLLGLLGLLVPALLNNNPADTALHLGSGLLALYFGTVRAGAGARA